MNYLQVYSFGSILSTSRRIYFREWVTLFSIYVVPLLAVHFFNSFIKTTGGLGLLIGSISFVFASFFVSFPFTVAISEICLDIKPNVGRSYRRAFAEPGKLIGSYLLVFLLMALGFIALVVPGIVLSVWYLFVGPVVILEALAGKDALRRSKELGRGHYLRNYAVVFAAQMISMLIVVVVGGMLGAIGGVLFGIHPLVAELIGGVVGLLLTPPAVIAFVLLYYDMRVRKEGYAAAQLADDLRF